MMKLIKWFVNMVENFDAKTELTHYFLEIEKLSKRLKKSV